MNTFEKVGTFKYLGVNLNQKEGWYVDINSGLRKVENIYYALPKYFKSKLFSQQIKIKLHRAVVKSTLTYDCEIWLLTKKVEQRLIIFGYWGKYVDLFLIQKLNGE